MIYGGSPSTCFQPLVSAEASVSCSRRGSAIRLFSYPIVRPHPTDSGIRLQLTNIMQTASIQRTAHLRPLTISTAPARAWLNAKSTSMSRIAGFEVTRRETLRVHLVFITLILGAAIAESTILGAALCLAIACHNVYKLNKEDRHNWMKYDDNLEAEEGGRA